MKATVSATTLILAIAASLPAADAQLLKLVMPDATVIGGANVAQARTTPFGQYAMGLLAPRDQQLQALATLTGFDPRRDVEELLVATTGKAQPQSGLLAVRGTFHADALGAAATLAGASTESYREVTILKHAQANGPACAFLGSSMAVLGDLASVKSAIDRYTTPRPLPTAVAAQIAQLSAGNDAWVLSTVPLASLHPPAAAPHAPEGLNLEALRQIRHAGLAVKLGTNVTVTASAQMDTAQNAATLAGLLQLLGNMAQLQAQKSPDAAALAKALTVASNGESVSLSFTMPANQILQLVESQHRDHRVNQTLEAPKQQ